MANTTDLALTALAPAIWGSTYLVTTEFLPPDHPLTVAMLRALPAGLLLLAVVRRLPRGVWWGRTLILGALNFAFFWAMLFVAAYRLPGGVAATIGAVQPLIVFVLARALLATPLSIKAILSAIAGMLGVAALILKPTAALDPIGIAAALAGAGSMAAGTVLSRRWQPPVSALTFTAWQLTAGGVLLLPAALAFEPNVPEVTLSGVLGLAYLGLIGAGLTYLLWFRGLARLGPSSIAPLGFLSPVTAVALGWLALGQSLTPVQILGFVVVLGSVWFGQAPKPSTGERPFVPRRVEADHQL
jgi:probable blue pigment (indigoidine) exporter